MGLISGDVTNEDLELIYQVINRFGALNEQYDMLEQTMAQLEMQMEILHRVPESKQIEGSVKQTHDQLVSAEAYRDAALRLIQDLTGKSVSDLRQLLVELRMALAKYSDLQTDYSKTKQAFDILAESGGFDPEEGQGGSRKEYADELDRLKQNKTFFANYLKSLVIKSLNKNSLVVPSDSVLGPLVRQSRKEI